MLVDLDLSKRNALAVIFNEKEVSIRLEQLIDAGSRPWVITSKSIAQSLSKSHRSVRAVEARRENREGLLKTCKQTISNFHPFLTMISTGSHSLDAEIASLARKSNSLVYVVDFPKLNDLNMPAVAKLGDVRVAISTRGNSPAMASILRKRIERNIREEDILQVKMQGLLRAKIKRSIRDPAARKKIIYRLLKDKSVRILLKQGKFEDATRLALNQ
ncbi:MAG: precorrin-2 dehydrogenase/sirohydrochlorin ferrochelatase family protein, partial [Rhabdochlamydiaceae bacterium]